MPVPCVKNSVTILLCRWRNQICVRRIIMDLTKRTSCIIIRYVIISLLWPPCVVHADIIFSSCGVLLLSCHLFSLPISQPLNIRSLPYFHTWCGLSANLECRSEMCCMFLAENTGCKNCQKFTICAPSHNFVGLYLRN